MASDKFITIRIKESSYARLKDLISILRRGGWSMVGAERGDSPGVSSVVDEAISSLKTRSLFSEAAPSGRRTSKV